jgi:hypothetical protein
MLSVERRVPYRSKAMIVLLLEAMMRSDDRPENVRSLLFLTKVVSKKTV